MSSISTSVIKTTYDIVKLHDLKKPLQAERDLLSEKVTAIMRQRENEEKKLRARMKELNNELAKIDAQLAQAAKEAR